MQTFYTLFRAFCTLFTPFLLSLSLSLYLSLSLGDISLYVPENTPFYTFSPGSL